MDDYVTDEARLLDSLLEGQNAQTAVLGKILERLTEIRVILQSLADQRGPSPTSG